ncbi:MAG: SDR family NAD(P)-dependent oxidoreductase [Oceanobacter sp.]
MKRRILITGAGRRLGKTLAEHFLQLGWQVVAHFNTVCELVPRENLTCCQADLSDSESLLALCERLAELGPFDAVVHNASCFDPDAAVDLDLAKQLAHVEKHYRVHVTAPFLITQALADQFAPSACMTVISDIYADVPNERFSAYCASKAGLQNWALSSAQRFRNRVRVNVIQPGPIQFLPNHDEAYRARVLSQSLTGEELGYGAIVKAIDYLMDNEAVTGTVMRVDGGRFVANRYDQTFQHP